MQLAIIATEKAISTVTALPSIRHREKPDASRNHRWARPVVAGRTAVNPEPASA